MPVAAVQLVPILVDPLNRWPDWQVCADDSACLSLKPELMICQACMPSFSITSLSENTGGYIEQHQVCQVRP